MNEIAELLKQLNEKIKEMPEGDSYNVLISASGFENVAMITMSNNIKFESIEQTTNRINL